MLQEHTTTLEQSSQFIYIPSNDKEFERLVLLLDEIVDIVRDDESHPLVKTMDVLSVLITNYEDSHIAEPVGSGAGVLKLLMDEHGLQPSDMPELGTESDVQQILIQEIGLQFEQVKQLSNRFQVPLSVFA